MITTNEYFNATVKSLGYTSTKGKSTIGVMEEGTYEFNTSTYETMTVIEGTLSVLLTSEKNWVTYKAGDSFEVEANSSFKVASIGQTSYLCTYQ